MSFWEKYELTIKKIFAILIAIVIFGWMMISDDTESEEPVITISYRCELALKSHDIPDHVKQKCIKLLKDKHEIEPD